VEFLQYPIVWGTLGGLVLFSIIMTFVGMQQRDREEGKPPRHLRNIAAALALVVALVAARFAVRLLLSPQ
jgi:hypothetical protein